jgi:cell division protein ZapB
MLLTRQNRLLPILSGIVVLMLLLVLMRACSDENEAPGRLDAVPVAARPDADTPADTIETLTANVAAMTAELKRLRETNARLKLDRDTLTAHEAQIQRRLDARIDAALKAQPSAAATGEYRASLEHLEQRIEALSQALGSARGPVAAEDLPVGLGLPTTEVASELVWIEPLDRIEPGLGDALREQVDPARNIGRPDATVATAPMPVYTVPRNATLMGATAMTALIGRVPVRGEVRDPMPFKLITGRDNLAANGLGVPGVHGMIWSGTAIGDWTLSCITGRLDSVTFVFDDGTIRTLATDDRDSQDGNRPLGWISDAHGIPCISGERKSNAAAFLSQRIGVKAMEAAAQAAAAAQTTTVLRDSGALSSRVAGDQRDYVLGKTLADAGSEVAAWLAERQAQNFDAVFVAAGGEVVIHVDRELNIDRDPNGRRLNHDTTPSRTAARPLD